MFHDIGKQRAVRVSEKWLYGRWSVTGHIIIGTEMVSDRIRLIPDFPEKPAVELKHCILAHHGSWSMVPQETGIIRGHGTKPGR